MANNKKFIVKNGLQTQNVGFVSPNAANTLEVALLDTDILQLDGNISVLGNVALTGTVDGRDVAADGTKLDGIASGAEVNQNAFSNIAVSGQTTVAADSKTDTLTLVAGTNVTITTDATTDSITINANDTSVDWSEIQNKPDPTVTVTLTGDVTGTANTTLTDLASGTISVATTIAANSVALGTDTTGNYVASVATTAPLSGGAAGSEGSTLTLSLASGYGDTQNPYASKTANTVLAAPNGSAGVPSFRTLVAQDIPALDASKITSGVFDAARLPSYVDDVLEYTNLASFPTTGETGKIYVDLATNKTYRWSGTVYVYITSGAVDSVAGKTGVVTLTNSDVGLGNVENKSSATIRGELTSANVTTALGYTPYNSTNPSGYTTNTGTVTSVAAGSYLTGGTITTSGTLAVDATSANTVSKVVARDASGNFSAGTITAALSGNASTASTWQTARTLTIGSTGKSVNGSSDVSWSLAEIGAAASSHTHSYLPLSGGTMTGVITTPNGTHGIVIGDDSRLADRNIVNTLFVEGAQNTDRGYINFSSTSGNSLGAINGGALTWNGNTIWHAANDGSGSGLDADLLDGLHAATANTASTVVARDASGNFSAGTITASLNGNATTAASAFRAISSGSYGSGEVYGSNNGWSGIRFNTPNSVFMVRDTDSYSGIYKTNSTWVWAFNEAGSLVTGTVPWTSVSSRPTALSSFTNDSGYTTNTGTVTSVATGTGLSGGTITTSGTISLANTAVTAGSYTAANITVDAQGRITAASNGTASFSGGTLTSVLYGVSTGMPMVANEGTPGSFEARAAGTGDSNLAGMTFHNQGYYAIKLGIRADGYFGLGGWSRAAWSWYSDPSGNMVAAGNVTAYSDPRLKENFAKVENPLEILSKLDGGTFNWKRGYSHTECKAGSRDYGILADQVELVMPEIVTESIEIDGEKYKTVAYEKLIPVLIEAIKELKAEIDLLKSVK